MNILIIRLSSMGDVILTSPLLTYLKNIYPNANLYYLTYKKYTDFFKDDPRLTSVTGVSSEFNPNDLSDLVKNRFDLIADLQNNRKSAGLRRKYFPSIDTGVFNKLRIKRLLLLLFRLNFYDKQNNVIRRYIKTACPEIDMSTPLPPNKLFFKKTFKGNDILPKSFSKSKTNIALIPFSAWKNKKWFISSYKMVGKYFSNKKWNVIILGGPEDNFEGERLKDEIGSSCFNLAGKISLYTAGLVLKQCNLALGNDTGLSHLARSCDVRTGIIYGSTTCHFGFFPHGKPPFKVFQSEEKCRPCHAHGGNICLRFFRPCLKKISVSQVISGLEELLKQKN